MALLNKAAILAADDLPTEDVEVPEWGGTVRVRGLTGTERDRFEFRLASTQKGGFAEVEFRAAIVGRCMVGEDGKRLFTDKELGRLGAKSGAALDRIFDVVQRLSGMDSDAAKAAAEDFGEAPSVDSASA